MVERDQIQPGDMLRLTRPYTIRSSTDGLRIVCSGNVTVVATVDEGDAKGHIALLIDERGNLHRIAAWWLEINSELITRRCHTS